MSRVYQNPPASTARRPPATRASLRPTPPHPPPAAASTAQRPPATRASLRPTPSHPAPPTSTANRSMTRGIRAPTHGRTMHTEPPRQERNDSNPYNEDTKTNQEERTTHIGTGYQMYTPSTTKREQMKRQAENEQRQYEAHIERTRLHGIHEVNRLGGDGISEDEVRRRQADKYRREKLTRLEKTHQDQFQKKQEEEKDIQEKKQAARQQAIDNENRDRNAQLHSMRSIVANSDQEASGWTDEAREDDRRTTMDRFLNRLTEQYDDMNISSDENEQNNHNNLSKSEKLSILHDTLPHIDDQTLERYLEIYNGNIDQVVHELLD